MRSDIDRTFAIVTVVLIAVAGWAVAGANGALATNSKVMVFFIANLVIMFDMIDLVARLWVRRLHGAAECGPSVDLCLSELAKTELTMTLKPYAIIVSVHNASDDIDRFLTAFEPLKPHIWIIDDASTDDTLLRLRRAGWNCVAGGINRNKPAALYHLVKLLPQEIDSVLVLDPDVRWDSSAGPQKQTLERVISDLQRSGAAALSPRINARRGTWLSECQSLEYNLACGLGRKSLGHMSTNSGVSLYRRSALQTALSLHSLSIYAEDLENSLLLLALGERIYYDDRLVYVTDAKSSWSHLFSQRVGWAFGCGKLFLERLELIWNIARRSPLGAYQYLFYLGISGILLLPFKLLSTAVLAMSLLRCLDIVMMTHFIPEMIWNQPMLFELWWLKAAAVTCVACFAALPRGERMRHIATVPFYCFYTLWQYAPFTLGLANVVALRLIGRRLYRDHYDRNPTLYRPRSASPTTLRST
jgi:cellulose synthase/poly-beta-1,6-N-acetylglucosamine synthase-like glycosyltransferase